MGITTPDINRRDFLAGFGKVALGGAGALLLKPGGVDARGSSWWHGLSQSSRNQAIIDTTAPWIGQWGGQCKEWIQREIVYKASRYHVWLPLNEPAPNDYMWQYDLNGNAVMDSASRLLENASVGWIVQMKLLNGLPHTAIIAGKMSQSVLFVDSNWGLDGYVQTHLMNYTDFYNMLWRTWSYSLYYIR